MGACDDCGPGCNIHRNKWQRRVRLPRRLTPRRHVLIWTLLCLVTWQLLHNRTRLNLFSSRKHTGTALGHIEALPESTKGEIRQKRPRDTSSNSQATPEELTIDSVQGDNAKKDQTIISQDKQGASKHGEDDEDDDEAMIRKHKAAESKELPVEGGLVIGKEASPDPEQEQSQESEQHLSLESRAESLPDFIYVPFEEAVRDEKLAGWEDEWIGHGILDTAKSGGLTEPKIDFVYLWVNGSEEEFRNTMLPWEVKSVLNDPEGLWMASHGVNRYRDWDELRYSLRSIHRNAGHFRNNIQILVNSIDASTSSDGKWQRQTPSWLREKSDAHNIQVVAQEDFFDKTTAACLPTFNSLTIENQLFNVPSNADHFFALSDDMLLGAQHSPSDIFSPLFGPVMGFKTNGYSTVSPPTEQDARRFGEKPYLIYTSWLLNRRFGIRKRKGQSHFGHSLSRSIMREAISSFPRPELRSACKRFRGEPGFQLYSWYVTFHYLIERHREALLWSYLMLRSDVDGDGSLSLSERRQVVQDIENGLDNLPKTSFRRRYFYHVSAALEKAGLAPPQVNTNIQWTSLDGPVSMRDADCSDFDVDDCLGPGFNLSRTSTGNPVFTSAVIFDRAARQNPHCGDCLLKIILHQVRQGMSPLLPSAEHQPQQRELVVKALMRYKYTIMDPTNSLFVMVTDADQVDSTLVRKYIREGKDIPGQLCLNDDVSTTDEDELQDTHEAMTELLHGMFPEKAEWER
ncbi:uncharacterized protein HMPREF1541_09575 [Cyphellophora europaea CBS 101466]|uniref:Uncharacterized protein n=1 Tax=Cyphellophora europaea (strain CBS 101466) TaxID=1220924 RepID=W2SAL6_CYPE1|nr:uncharacterized protein HMPREF1541_09575 [Cyphellophora europaea CBS 101466]ETN45742.1 hypothetical protein HMPREF1541_09575 [Cyphellophora europaea CBS 101466]